MIEKINLEELDFSQISLSETIKRVSLKNVAESVFPLFEKAFRISSKYDTRAKLSEDEDFINIKVEMNEKLAALRECFEKYGFSSEDEEYIDELNSKWKEYIKEFPVFKGDPFRLFIFWSLSFLDIMGIVFESKHKTVSMVELFFYEKIIDYIVSEIGEDKINKSDIIKIIENIEIPIDRYRGLNLILHYIYIEDQNIKDRLFKIYENLISQLKTKISSEDIIIDRIKSHIIQKEYLKAEKMLEDKKNNLLKKRPSAYVNTLLSLYRASEREGELLKLFNSEEFINKIYSIIPEEEQRENVSHIILSNIEINKQSIKEYLFALLQAGKKKNTENFIAFFIANLKQKNYEILKKEFDFLEEHINIFSSDELLDYFYIASEELSFSFKHKKDKFIKKLIEGAKKKRTKEHRIILFLWEIILERGLEEREVLEFLKALEYIREESASYIFYEKELLKEYLSKRDEILKKEEISVEEYEKYSFSEFAGDLFEKDLREMIRTKLKEGKKEQILPEAELILKRAPGDEEIFGILEEI